jgi:hypothetical protein
VCNLYSVSSHTGLEDGICDALDWGQWLRATIYRAAVKWCVCAVEGSEPEVLSVERNEREGAENETKEKFGSFKLEATPPRS